MSSFVTAGGDIGNGELLAQNAQDTANDANKKNSANSQQIANINDPNYLTPFEKPQLEIQMDNFATIYKTDKDIATAEGIDFTAYDAAYQAYLAYMKPLTADISTYSPIVRTTFNSLVVAVQNAQKAFNAATQAKYDQDMDKAKTDIANGQSSYAAMKQDVATMKTNANSVATIASAAISSAGFANDTASTASQAANDAKTIASQAANNVAIAKNDAANALTSAASAAGQAGTALSNTNTAMSSAANVLDTVSKLSVGENLYLQSTESTGYGTGAGTVAAASVPANEHISDYIAVDSTQPYVLQDWVTVPVGGESWYAINFYDKNKVSISRDAWGYDVFTASQASYSVTKFNKAGGTVIPATTAYVRISFRKYTDGKVSFTKGSVVPGYAPNPEDIQQQFTDINGQLSSKVSQNTYDGLADTVSQTSTLAKQNQNELVSKADSSDVNVLKQRVTTAENTLTQTATKTALKQTKTDVDNINNTVQTNTSNISAQAGKIDGLLSTTSTLGNNYNTLENKFTVSSGELSNSIKQVQTSVGNLSQSFDSNTSTAGYTSGSDGSFTTYASNGEHRTDYIPIDPTKQYYLKVVATVSPSGANWLGMTFYDKNKKFISRIDGYAPAVTTTVLQTSVLAFNYTDSAAIRSSAIPSNAVYAIMQARLYSDGVASWGENLATVTALTQVKQTAEGAQALATNNQGDITSLQATAKGLQTTVKNKADATKVTALSNLFNVTVKSLGSPNLVPMAGWTTGADGSGSPSLTGKHSFYTGDNTLYRIVNSTTIENYSYSQRFALKRNTTYTFSFICFAASGVKNVDAMILARASGDTASYTKVISLIVGANPSPSEAQYFTSTFTTGAVDSGYIRIDNNGSTDGVAHTVYFTEVQIEEGSVATPYRLADSQVQSQFAQLSNDINLRVKKGDVVNQFNIDAGGALLQTSGANTKIVLSAPNIIFDTANPVQIPNANIEDTLTGKTIEAGTITATTKIISSDIEASLIHSKDNSFSLNGATGDIVGPSIHAADNSWGISNAGKIHGTSITASVMDISGDGKGPNFDAVNVTPDTTQGIYSRYKYSVNSGYDVNKSGRKLYKNGYLVINGDTFLNRTIGDWSADGGGKYVYDTMYEAHTIKMRAYNYTGSNVQTDDPSSTEGSISSRLDIQPSAITMGRDWSVRNPNILIDGDGLLKVGSIAINGHHSMGTTDGSDMYFMHMNKDATDVSGTSIPIHAARYYTANMGISGGHVINSYDGGDVYLEDKWGSGGNTVSLHVKKLYNSSLLSLKTDITTIDPNDALETIANTDFRSYRFKTDDPSEPKSVSPILDDENQIPIYNTPNIFKSADGKSRNDGNILGYTALSVQALYAKIKDLTTRLQKLEGAN